MKILHLISSGGMYGAEAVILSLSHALRLGGDESVVASLSNASRQLHERAMAEGLTSVLIPCNGPFSPATVSAIREAAAHFGADVVHAHGYKADVYAWAALRKSGMPLVSTCHTWYDNDVAVRVYGALDRQVLRGYARVVAVSAQVEQRLLRSGVQASRMRRIQNGVDMVPFAVAADARATVPAERGVTAGLVGRLAPEKGVDIFLEAAAIVTAELPHVRFRVVGEGPERPRLEQQRHSLGLDDRVDLPGHQASMMPVYAGLDLLISASRQEGLPIALLEGMASGLPVVATSVGEVPALVLPGKTGLLVAPNDAAALARAMLQLLSNTAERLTMGRNARTRIEQEFSISRMTGEYRQLYRETLAGTGGRA